MKILFVIDSLDMGGAERHVTHLARAMSLAGHCVTVASSQGGILLAPLSAAGITCHVLMPKLVKRKVNLPYTWRLRRLIRELRPDVLHAHCYASTVASVLAATVMPVTVVVTEHSDSFWQGPITRRIAVWACRHSSHVIAVSNVVRAGLVDRGEIGPAHITWIPNAIPSSQQTHPAPAYGELPDPGDGPVIGVVARLRAEKGVDVFLESFAQVARSYPVARCVIVGDGPLRATLQALAARLRIQNRVCFLSMREDTTALIRLFTLLVVPSYHEGAPLVVLEAMAAGTPIVATAVGGIPEQLRHRREALLVPPGKPQALTDAVMELLSDPQLGRSLASAARLRVDSMFTFGRMVSQVETIYRSARGMHPMREEVLRQLPR